MNGSDCEATARAAASSPRSWTIDWTPTGASITGAAIAVPRMLVLRSREATSRTIRGTISKRSKAARFARSVRSAPAPPAT